MSTKKKGRGDDKTRVVRFAASRVAAVIGLHEYADPAEDFLEYIYQDREELLSADARKLQLTIVTKDDEVDALVIKTGDALAPELRELLAWAADRTGDATQLDAAHARIARADALIALALQAGTLAADNAQLLQQQFKQRIHQSVGIRNERLALQSYEQQQSCTVRLANEHRYFLAFPPPPPSLALLLTTSMSTIAPLHTTSTDDSSNSTNVFVALDALTKRGVFAPRPARDKDSYRHRWSQRARDPTPADPTAHCYFSVSGMVDGVADVLAISSDDDWSLTPVVVEVKNRVRSFRDPPPLHDHIQMAVYMKMLALVEGDLVQCLNQNNTSSSSSDGGNTANDTKSSTAAAARICVSRVALGQGPLSDDVWTRVVVPRLYAYVAAVERVRANDLLRLAFLNGSANERLVMLRRECDFL